MKHRMGLFVLPILLLSFGLAFGAARDSDTLVIAQGVDAASLDSMGLVDAPSFNVRLNIYDTLLQRDANLKIEPLLAESYRLIDDLTWEFKLRKGVKFHNGEDFNAAAVKFNLERLADPAYLLGWGDTTYDADFTLYLLRTGQAVSNYSNPQFDALFDQGQITMDKEKRKKIYFDAQKLMHEDVPFAWCYQQVDIYGVNERVNWKARPDERLVVFDMSFKK